ncbi:hypothetical protein HAX54_016124 [Datura stramonium]|uniref:Uncharacterized protein n=1 Tax=Datura stramonium TaxID=4076 RepID=A0ABS8RZQ3_DATST|nr:hypothetical protein [Datura stramonium]
MSEDERKNGHNMKEKMKSGEEQVPEALEDILSQMDADAAITRNPRTPRFPIRVESADQSTDLLPLEQGEAGTNLLAGSTSRAIPSSAAVQGEAGTNLLAGSTSRGIPSSATEQGAEVPSPENVQNQNSHDEEAEGSKKKRILPKRNTRRLNFADLEVLPKGSIVDSENDPTTDDDTDESDSDYLPVLN